MARKRQRPTLKDYLKTGIVQGAWYQEEKDIKTKERENRTREDLAAPSSSSEPLPQPSAPERTAAAETSVPERQAVSAEDVLALLTEKDLGMWKMLLSSGTDIIQSGLELPSLREDFRTADRSRFTYYILKTEGEALTPVKTSSQIRGPIRALLKWDEMGSLTLYVPSTEKTQEQDENPESERKPTL